MVYRPWEIFKPDNEKIKLLQNTYNLSSLVCGVLLARGNCEHEQVSEIIDNTAAFDSPMSISGMDKAVERILYAVDNEQRIVVFGDYDVDGVTATALVYTYLDSIGADVYYKLPSREDDGYGLFSHTIDDLHKKNVDLIVTVDTGISANEAIDRANELGIDVVITDHHLPPDVLPKAYAIVDPQLDKDNTTLNKLCGAGVAYMLVCALECCECEDMLDYYSDLAAIGTVADIMSLQGINRHLVKAGLDNINNTDRPGIAALIEVCGFSNKQITAENIAFGLSPRLNAAGRMDSAVSAIELLLCEDEQEAMQRAQELNEQNIMRQKAEQDISKTVFNIIEQDPQYEQERILVVAAQDFHAGVIGIVASRVAEKYGKPTIIISIDKNGEGKGSGRSIGGVSLYNAIAHCEDLLIRFGGHELAAGMSVHTDNIKAFRQKINEWADINHPILKHNALKIDVPVNLAKITTEDVMNLDVLSPFGHGNSTPVFCIENVVIDEIYSIGENKHSRLRFNQNGNLLFAVIFGKSPESLCYKKGDMVDVAICLSVFEGKNGVSISGRVKDIKPAGLGNNYIDEIDIFEAFNCNATLTQQQKQQIMPTRSDVADVYRYIKNGICVNDLRPVFNSLGADRTGKILVALKALCQLNLISLNTENNTYTYIQTEKKQNILDAPVICSLSNNL